MHITVTPATPEDLDHLLHFVHLLAEFDTAFDGLDINRDRFHDAFFGPSPKIKALLARDGDQVVGLANYFFTFSSFQSLPCIWLEDLYVLESHRKCGVGKALLNKLQAIARTEDCKHIEWLVEASNLNGIDFYKHLGANVKEDLRYVQLSLNK